MGKYFWLLLLVLFAIGFYSCQKFLDKPSSRNEVRPETLAELQALLEHYQAVPDLAEIVTDNYYVSPSRWQQLLSNGADVINNQPLHYIWEGRAIRVDEYWQQPYLLIYYSNIVLEQLSGISTNPDNQAKWSEVKGNALFKRGYFLHLLAQLYCRPYSSTASTDLGLPLRLNSNLNEVSVRSSVEQTYNQIISDLKEAAELLPETTTVPTRPNKAAAYGALARVYLSMRDYVHAGQYAELALAQNSYLLDYSSLSVFAIKPIPLFNKEVLYHSEGASSSILANVLVDSVLYQSYNTNDLRRTIFFTDATGGHSFRGSYTQVNRRVFTGIATDEVYLIRAESYARLDNKDAAMNDLNTLLRTRWKKDNLGVSTYVDQTATDAADALKKVLGERRKELIWRGLRWSDLRRLNLPEGDGANITLTRIIDNATYTLPPNDLRWVILIPQDVINFSGIEQNPRLD